jgi:formate dehydrogenase
MAGNPISSTPDADKFATALQSLDLMVSLDMYITETNQYADFILPAPTFYERPDILLPFGGTMPRPWVQYTEPVVDVIGDTREEWVVFSQLLNLMGIVEGPGPWELIEQLIDESPRAIAEGWTMDRIKAHPHGVELGGDVTVGVAAERISLYTHGARDKVDIGAPEVLAQLSQLAEFSVADDELLMIGRRDLRSINSWMHNVRPPRRNSAPSLHIHPNDAAARGIATGDIVDVATAVGTLAIQAEVTDDIHEGTVSYPHGWGHEGGWSTAIGHGGVNINKIVPNDLASKDPLSGMSFLDGVPVRISPRVKSHA